MQCITKIRSFKVSCMTTIATGELDISGLQMLYGSAYHKVSLLFEGNEVGKIGFAPSAGRLLLDLCTTDRTSFHVYDSR